MNVAYLKAKPWQESGDCGFESHGPSEEFHCRAFVHGYADVPYHWHREMEILFVLRGRFRLVVDGQACEMGEDDLIVINADVPHNSTSTSRDALVCGVHLDVTHFERMGLTGFASREYLCRTFLHSRSFLTKVAPIKALMARLILDQVNRPEEMLARQTIANLIACYLYRWIPYQTAEAGNGLLRPDSRNRILRIMDTLGGQDDAQHLSEIAEAEGLTLSHLSRLFKRHLGIGYRDYSQNLRLDNCAGELRATDDTISTIMERNGFGNPAVFYNKFRARFGCSPAEFRRGRRPLRPQSLLTDEDTTEALMRLTGHAAGVGKAAELAVGLSGPAKRQVVINGPHNPGRA
ncbi:AraC family transcriptional regulator [Pararhizobium sp. YC-54]|uniref:helix-turn-helix transcriptional regulator n=1 Tax=Pararhizobium sp. YC-54 TaxID=2986920 RepID=UPI0021F70EB2|nr:AraC family transcriptional regulator [Pararhizobium sp. YC-54]MCW0001101.1 AraC family transcriptional regulator [Pararhizobium sp. YC-54]